MTNLIAHIMLFVSWIAYALLACLMGEDNLAAVVLRSITGGLVGFCLGNAITEVL